MKNFQLLFIFLIVATSLKAQTQLTLDNNATSLRWNQINTPSFRIVFPMGFEQQAQRMANTLEKIQAPESKTMGGEPRKISVVLQNQSSVSNGFVTITPRRSEFYTMPSQNYNFLGTNDWLNLLASHEYRHVVQYQHANRGFNRLFYYLFGANTLSAMSHVGAPLWFWEGDAVATETAFTPSGRGRIPNFSLLFRTNLLEGRTFNYHKQYLRSYKNNIPDHYVLGFHLVSYLRKRTNDPEIWEKITARAWSVPFIPFTFSNAIKKETGLYVTKLYKAMASDLKKEWQLQIDSLQLTPFAKINPRTTKAYTSYQYPQPLADGSILAMKRGIGNIERFVILKDGEEHKGFTPGFINETGMLSTANGKVVWNEYGYDPRWTVRNYSLIKTYDFNTKKKKRIGSRHERYAGAALSPDGEKIITVSTGNDYKTNLVVLDVNSGNIIKELSNPENYFISMPRWTDDGKRIVALRTVNNNRTISLFDVASGGVVDLLNAGEENVGHPVLSGDYLFYNSPVTGIDNIFMYDTKTKVTYQVTSSKYGAYNPAIAKDGKSIYYNEQSRDGMDVVRIPFDVTVWRHFTKHSASGESIADVLTKQEGRPDIFDSIPNKKYQIKHYSKLKGMINPYSWGAFVTNNLAQASVGISSQDILSTTRIDLGYQYDINERTGLWKAGVSYQGFYPIIDFNLTSGTREQNTGVLGRDVKFNWRETGMSGGLRIPLIFTRSKYITQLEIGNSFGVTKVSSFRNEVSQNGVLISRDNRRIVQANDTLIYIFNDRVDDGTLLSNAATISFTRSLKQSRRDFNPKLAQFVNFEHYSTPYGGDFKGRLWAARGAFYFPGVIKHHSLYFRGGYQDALSSLEVNAYDFRNRIFKPRGYAYPRDSKFYTLSVNYTLPIWYPDINIGPLLNIQRIKANLFYDYGNGEGKYYFYSNQNNRVYYLNTAATYQSKGLEITFDINVMRFLPQFEIGFRTSFIDANQYNSKGVKFEILIGNIPF